MSPTLTGCPCCSERDRYVPGLGEHHDQHHCLACGETTHSSRWFRGAWARQLLEVKPIQYAPTDRPPLFREVGT